MQWEELTAPEFEKAVKETGCCIITMGIVEKHGEHLPLGTDYLDVHKLACLAAEKEPAVVFPPFYFGQIYEARCFPGCITLKPTLVLEVIEGVLDEIARNGFRKIIMVNGHGGNSNLLPLIAQCSLWKERPYSLYIPTGLNPREATEAGNIFETTEDGHAGERETSAMMANYPDLVKTGQIPAKPGASLKRMEHLPPTYSGIWWYARYPEHYAGDARPASAEKGRAMRDITVGNLADYIAAVKADDVIPALEKDFFARERGLRE